MHIELNLGMKKWFLFTCYNLNKNKKIPITLMFKEVDNAYVKIMWSQLHEGFLQFFCTDQFNKAAFLF